MVDREEATNTLGPELRRVLGDAYDAGFREPLDLLTAVNEAIVVILQNIEDPDYRAYVAERFIDHFPRLVEAAAPGYRQTRH